MCGGLVLTSSIKPQRRNSDKRKEKSRDAARCRRNKESEIFQELQSVLPQDTSLDKTSMIRIAIGQMKLRHLLDAILPQNGRSSSTAVLDSCLPSLLRGFIVILSDDGNMVYLSETVCDYLGISQIEMIGNSIFDFTHPCDHDEVKSLLTNPQLDELDHQESISIFLRMKSSLKTSGKGIGLKPDPFQMMKCMGYKLEMSLNVHYSSFYVFLTVQPVFHGLQIVVPSNKQGFFSKHSPDMKFIEIDENIRQLFGYSSSDLIGKSLFEFQHATDSIALEKCYKTLFQKGQCETGYYRFLAKYGGHVWLLTRAVLIYDNYAKPECILCHHYILSGIENKGEIVCCEQVSVRLEEADQLEISPLSIPISNTPSIFVPKEEQQKVMSFHETEVLLFQESMKDKLELEFLDDDDPCRLVTDNEADDPFINYRDTSLSPGYCGTPDSSLPQSYSSGSPDHLSTTPSTPDSGSLSDIPSLDPIDEFANLDLKLSMSPTNLSKECDYEDVNLDRRAPFIPMSIDDDFPLISPSNPVMWGPQEPISKWPTEDNSSERIVEQQSPIVKPKTSCDSVTKSSLAALLQSDLKKHPLSRHEKNKSANHRDPPSHKKWSNTHQVESRSNSVTKLVANVQKHQSYRNATSAGGGGHIIMLDALPYKKQLASTKTSSYHHHKKNVNNVVNHHSSIGSHTATVKVHDRLIKVQVSVSELPSIEHKQAFQSHPDPSPKRLGSMHGPNESPKRLKVDNSSVTCTATPASDSVLLNLLISGEDASRGYLSSGNSRFTEPQQCKAPKVASLPVQSDSLPDSVLLPSESELLDSFLNISQYDTDINTPIQTSHLLQGEDLLDALELPPSLRDVPILV